MPRSIVIVDGFRASVQLVKEFARRGYSCIHVQSSSKGQIQHIHRDDSHFKEVYLFDGELDALLLKITPSNVVAVLAGTESGVTLADQISEQLNLPHNQPQLRMARRNKYLMNQAVAKQGLRHIQSFCSDQWSEVQSWSKSQSYPLIIKPVHSAGTDQVLFCQNETELESGFRSIVGHINNLGLKNETVIVQEKIDGLEYVVNTVSQNSRHMVTEVWLYHKRKSDHGNLIYDWDELVSPDQVPPKLLEYALSVLDALGIENGPAHTEIFIDALGPVHVETGARIDGMAMLDRDRKCLMQSQIDLTVEVATRQGVIKHEYKTSGHASNVSLISSQSGEVTRFNDRKSIESLASFHSIKLAVQAGQSVSITRDYNSSPGLIFLHHRDLKTLQADYERIREFESKVGFFQCRT